MQVQILLAESGLFAIARASYNDPGWKYGESPYWSTIPHKKIIIFIIIIIKNSIVIFLSK